MATPLERQFSTIAGLDALTSTSGQGNTSITLQFTLDRDIDDAAADVAGRHRQTLRRLPQEHGAAQLLKVDLSQSPVLIFALTSATLPLSTSTSTAQTLISQRPPPWRAWRRCGCTAARSTRCASSSTRRPWQPEDRPRRVSRAISTGNVNLPSGILWGTDRAYAVEAEGGWRAPRRSGRSSWRRDGVPVRLGDLGRVIDSVQRLRPPAGSTAPGPICWPSSGSPAPTPWRWRSGSRRRWCRSSASSPPP
ncbi:MAG: efflux RND transporter permease subunit [Gemmatimonadetes bacterium]|nr:efflux RND transporter permease subunit [Gemmatimonadota bacterium]